MTGGPTISCGIGPGKLNEGQWGGNGRTSIRAAYSYSYDFPGIQYHINTSIAPPRIPKITVRSVPFDDPWRDSPGGSPFPFVVDANAPFPPFAVFTTMRYDTKNPAISQWNLSMQRQFSSDLLISASYIGSNSTHLWTQKNLNTAVYIPGSSSTANTDQRRKLFLQEALDTNHTICL